jgi:hypothetical protein
MNILYELNKYFGIHIILISKINNLLKENNIIEINNLTNNCSFNTWINDKKTILAFKKENVYNYYFEIKLIHDKIHEELNKYIKYKIDIDNKLNALYINLGNLIYDIKNNKKVYL